MSNGNRGEAAACVRVTRCGEEASKPGPADWFSGQVRIDPLFNPEAPARTAGALVTFEPGARTAWHSHPFGQFLVVTAGCGRVQQWGQPVQVIRPGDVVSIPPNAKHWHGAAPHTAMTHIAIHELRDGEAVAWMEDVSEAVYQTEPGSVPSAQAEAAQG